MLITFFAYFCTRYQIPSFMVTGCSRLMQDDAPCRDMLLASSGFKPTLRMNKILLTIAVLGMLTLFTSAYYSAPADSRIGYKAPALVLGDKNNDLSPLQQQRGENVLLTFWSSDDAESRLSNQNYDRLVRGMNNTFIHVSVNLDRSESVFSTIVALDSLDRSSHYHSSAEVRESIIRNWRLDDGFHSFLLDGEGKIIAIDPDASTLAGLN